MPTKLSNGILGFMLNGFWQSCVKAIFVFAVFTSVFLCCGHSELRSDIYGGGGINGRIPASGQVASSPASCCRDRTEQIRCFQQNINRQEEPTRGSERIVGGFVSGRTFFHKPVVAHVFIDQPPSHNIRLSILQTYRS